MTCRMHIAALLLAPIVTLAACAGAQGSAPDAGPSCPTPARADAPARSPADAGPDPLADAEPGPEVVGIGDAAAARADAGGARWAPPPCTAACDRLVDCGVDACEGFEWTTAGGLDAACQAACDAAFLAAVAAAPDCRALLAGPAGAAVPLLAERCAANPCAPACAWVAECVVAECPAFEPSMEPLLAEDCTRTCDSDDLAGVTAYPCPDLVAAIATADPAFATACRGAPAECADVALCDPYGARVAECLRATCGERVGPYEAGLRWAFAEFCRSTDPCAPAADVAAVLDPALTCAAPLFANLGTVAPFVGLCQGTNGVTPEAVRAACAEVLTCAGTSWLPDVDACMALVVLREDAAAVTGCVGVAAGCGQVFDCFAEEP